MRQTGGTALGEISTRSKERSRAIFRASKGGMTPSCSPFSSMTRISRARIRSLVRMKDLAERLSIGGIIRLHSGFSDSLCVVQGLIASACSTPISLRRNLKYSISDKMHFEPTGWIGTAEIVSKSQDRSQSSYFHLATLESTVRS